MKAVRMPLTAALCLSLCMLLPSVGFGAVKISGAETVGDTVTIEGSIAPGQELYLSVAQQTEFKPSDAPLPHESVKFTKSSKSENFAMDTSFGFSGNRQNQGYLLHHKLFAQR